MTESAAPPPAVGAEDVLSVVGALALHAARAPDRPAYVDAQGTVGFGALYLAARRGAAWLSREGVRAGDSVALVFAADESAARRAIELLYAAAYLGAVVLPLFPDVPPAVRGELIERCGVRWWLGDGSAPQASVARVLDLRRFAPDDASLDQVAAPRGDMAGAAFIHIFTSGTTGDARRVLVTHGQAYGRLRSWVRAMAIDGSDRLMSPIPWPSSVALRYVLRAAVGGAAFANARLGETRAALGAALARYAVTHLAASPWQVRRLLQSPPPAQPLPPLRALDVAGAAISQEEIAAARAVLTLNLQIDYGCSEIGILALLAADDAMPAPGRVGRLVEGVEGRADGVQGGKLAAGEVGDLGFRAAWMSGGYAGNEQATRERFRKGWFYPGDAGSVDAAGNVTVRGRTQEVINYGGLKIWPGDIEAVLKQHRDVLDAALVGLPDRLAGQVPAAFVVRRVASDGHLSAGLGEADLRSYCAARIDAARIPVYFFEVSEIPRNDAGKVLREMLIDVYLQTIGKTEP